MRLFICKLEEIILKALIEKAGLSKNHANAQLYLHNTEPVSRLSICKLIVISRQQWLRGSYIKYLH